MPRRVLVRPITYEQARSYRKLRPNGLGVTAIAAVNGRGAYARRYRRARSLLLGQTEEQMFKIKRRRGRGRYRRNEWVPTSSSRAGVKTYVMRSATDVRPISRAGTGWPAAARRAKKKLLTAEQIAAAKAKAAKKAAATKARRTRALKKARAAVHDRKSYAKRTAAARKHEHKKLRRYGKKFIGDRVWIGRSNVRDSYVYTSRRGTLKKIPRYALLGFGSKREMDKAAGKDAALKARIDAKTSAWDKRRQSASARMLKSGGLFVPNRRRARVMSFAEWESKMKVHRGRRKARKSYSKNRSKRVVRGRGLRRRRLHTVGWSYKLNKRGRKGAKKVRRVKHLRAKSYTRRFKGGARRVGRMSIKLFSRNAADAGAGAVMVANRRRRRRKGKRHFTPNRSMMTIRRRYKKATPIRGFRARLFRRNPYTAASSFKDQILEALTLGGIATGGFFVHRVVSRLVSQKAPWFKDQDPPTADLLASALVAAVGIPLAAKFLPKQAKVVAAGMVADFLVLAVSRLAQKYDTGNAYYPYLAGLGSYYELPGRRGRMGEYVMGPGARAIQAQAGFGRLTQAAAGFGRLTQAAAGFGQLRQAAAGVGEYVATDLEGIGDYVEVTPELTAPADVDNGIMPTLSDAEAALNVAEGASGIGGNVPAQYMVDPTDQTTALSEEQIETDRNGLFAGRDGIFGPLQ